MRSLMHVRSEDYRTPDWSRESPTGRGAGWGACRRPCRDVGGVVERAAGVVRSRGRWSGFGVSRFLGREGTLGDEIFHDSARGVHGDRSGAGARVCDCTRGGSRTRHRGCADKAGRPGIPLASEPVGARSRSTKWISVRVHPSDTASGRVLPGESLFLQYVKGMMSGLSSTTTVCSAASRLSERPRHSPGDQRFPEPAAVSSTALLQGVSETDKPCERNARRCWPANSTTRSTPT